MDLFNNHLSFESPKENWMPSKFSHRVILIIVLYLFSQTQAKAVNNSNRTIKIAAIDWCPQLCIDTLNPGYVNEIIRSIYPSNLYKLEVDYFPWSRAIKLVEQGKYDALLSPAKAEAPNLKYPLNAIGTQQMCFFTLKSKQWSFDGSLSLNGMSIGVPRDASIEELNEFMARNIENFQVQTYLSRYVEQNSFKLIKGRLDTFLSTKQTTMYELKRLGLSNKIKEAGCVSKANIYVAFTPLKAKEKYIQELIKRFDKLMPAMSESGVISNIINRYEANN